MSKRVFISYSHLEKDTICAESLEHFLKLQNCEVWIDYNSIKGGNAWALDIDIAIQKADAVIAILSKNSVQSEQVVREINLALERRMKEKETFSLIFLTIGQYHSTWFQCENIDKIKQYLNDYQYIQLKSNGALTMSTRESILKALSQEMVDYEKNQICNYIFDEATPQEQKDNHSLNKRYYRLHASELSPSTVISYVMDNQWLPNEMIEDKRYSDIFYKDGFCSPEIKKYMETYRKKHLYSSLMFNRQLVLNRAALLNNHFLQKYYVKKQGSPKKEQDAFLELLNNGSIVTFFYENNFIDPWVNAKNLGYSVSENIVEDWNSLVENTSMYCVRENWSMEVDFHKIEITKFTETISLDERGNKLLAENFGIKNKEAFYMKLKNIEETVFANTHQNKDTVAMYNRSTFYKDFIVDNEYDGNPVLDCIIDKKKPFCLELKKIIDIYYNAIFINLLHCNVQMPIDTSPKDLFISIF